MAFIQPGGEDVGAAGLSLNLSSNNPFRNRTTSPIPSGQLSPNEPPPRPVSRNPFLDDAGTVKENIRPQQRMPSPAHAEMQTATLTGNAAELFDELTFNDKPSNVRPTPPNRTLTDTSRLEGIPPRGPPNHRPTRSQEQSMRQRAPPIAGKPRPPAGELNIFADSSETRKSSERRPRRNSDSSLMERGSEKVFDAEEEKKRQERRRRERRHREREASKNPKSKKPDRKLDIIDQLDATSIYGTGLFHHDGPFDACNPHRNRQGSRRAPMQAFPKDSLNNVLGGGGPLNKRPDHASFLGNNDREAFNDYSTGGAGGAAYEGYGSRPIAAQTQQPNVQSSLQKVEPVHGDESLGLGTSTFLEGAPASRAAIQRTAVESATAEASGLTRKKSLAQKIRGKNNVRRDLGPMPPQRIGSAEPRYSPASPEQMTPNGTRLKANERNPFFNEFEPSGDRKESITFVEPEFKHRRSPSSPGGPSGERLERRATTDSTGAEEAPKQSMGFLSRVKSMKGGPRRPKAEKPVYD